MTDNNGDALRDQSRKIATGGGDYIERGALTSAEGGRVTLNLDAQTDRELLIEILTRLARVEAVSERNNEFLENWHGNGNPGLGEQLRSDRQRIDALAGRVTQLSSLAWVLLASQAAQFVIMVLHIVMTSGALR